MIGKSIEWDKGTLKGLVIEADVPNSNSENRTKPEKIYKLTKEITPELCEKAQEKIYKNVISSKSEKDSKYYITWNPFPSETEEFWRGLHTKLSG